VRVLVVEDGTEYVDVFRRFLADRLEVERAGSGPEALDRLARGGVDAVFLDMRFDRAPALLGDPEEVAEAFNGDLVQARAHLEDQQGLYVLAAIRDAGNRVPVLLSYDFSSEPRRWDRLRARHAPVDHLPDGLRPDDVLARLSALVRG
jgi:DNA-binding response OmpR family regulator